MKLFVCSDLHGFYTEFKEALDKTNFESGNDNHQLIVCGDLFDRGTEAKELWKYLKSIPNKILIRGNHEDLMWDLIDRGFPYSHDKSNRTWDTAKQIAWNKELQEIDWNRLAFFMEDVTSQMVDYYETENYIFVHSWIPLDCNDIFPDYYTKDRKFSYREDWKKGDWNQARWGNPVEHFKNDLNKTGKTIVCGHWHTSAAHSELHNEGSEWGEDANFNPFYDNHLIMIDGCIAYSKQVNIIELEDDLIA